MTPASSLETIIMAAEEPPPTVTARVATELMNMARIVCAHTKGAHGRPIKLTDYLDSILRGKITRDYEHIMQRIAQEQSKGKKS